MDSHQTPGGSTPDPLARQAQDYIASCRSDSTRQAYQRDWRHFTLWCEHHRLEPLPAPPETVARYVADAAWLYRPITLGRQLAAISVRHQTSGFPSPVGSIVVRDTMAGIRRHHGTAQARKAPIRACHLRRAVEAMPNDLRGLRNRAILLLGYVGALRRSEVVALRVEDIQFVDQGLRLTVRRSKTDQEGSGIVMGIGYGLHPPTCPVRALRTWWEAAGIQEGPVFRSVSRCGGIGDTPMNSRTIALIIKGLAPEFGIDRDTISGHSLRAGFITDQYAAGTAEAVIMERSRHRSHFVMASYRREADMFAFNYTAAVGL